MKQHITVKQLGELSKGGKNKLHTWWEVSETDLISVRGEEKRIGTEDCSCECEAPSISGIEDNLYAEVLPLLSIGQMLEFLSDNLIEGANIFDMPSIRAGRITQHELCDFLWEAVKSILEIKSSKK